MTRPRGTLTRIRHRDPDQPLDHRRLLRAAHTVGTCDVSPTDVLAVGPVWRRPVDACGPSMDRHRALNQLRRAGRSVLARQPMEQGGSRLDTRLRRVLANEEEDVPEVARFNAGQKFVFWSMALLIPVLFFTGIADLGRLFHVLHFDRAAALCTTDPFPGGDCGDHRLDHPCLCCDLGQGIDARDDSGLCDTGVGLAASSQMVPGVGGDGIHRSRAA